MVSPSITSFATLLAWHFGHHSLRLAAGPAFHLVTQKATEEYYRDNVNKKVGKAGFVVEGGLRFPDNTLVFADIQIQYQHVGRVGFGPYTFHRHYYGSDPETFTVSFNDVRMNMLVLGFGLGLRLP